MKKLLLTTALVALAAMAYGQGTVQFINGTFTRFQLHQSSGVTSNVPSATPLSFGLFWGTSASEVQAAILPVDALGSMSTVPGIMTAPNGAAYQIPGTQPGQVVFLQIRGWSSSFGADWRAAMAAYNAGVAGTIFGQTDIRSLGASGLGPTAGPGVAIWQTATQTNPNLFNPLQLFQAIPEPSVIALGIIGLGSLVFFRRRK